MQNNTAEGNRINERRCRNTPEDRTRLVLSVEKVYKGAVDGDSFQATISPAVISAPSTRTIQGAHEPGSQPPEEATGGPRGGQRVEPARAHGDPDPKWNNRKASSATSLFTGEGLVDDGGKSRGLTNPLPTEKGAKPTRNRGKHTSEEGTVSVGLGLRGQLFDPEGGWCNRLPKGSRKTAKPRQEAKHFRRTHEGGKRSKLSARQLAALRAKQLQTVEPNPGPCRWRTARRDVEDALNRLDQAVLLMRPHQEGLEIWAAGWDEDGVDVDSVHVTMSAVDFSSWVHDEPTVARCLDEFLQHYAHVRVRGSQLDLILVERGWIRDLVAEGVEPNPGPGSVRLPRGADTFVECRYLAPSCSNGHYHFAPTKDGKPAGGGAPKGLSAAERRLAEKKKKVARSNPSNFVLCHGRTSDCPRHWHLHPLAPKPPPVQSPAA